MKKLKAILFLVIGIVSWNVNAEEVYTSVINFSHTTQIDWQITNEDGHTAYSSQDFTEPDSAFFFLEGETAYRLNIQVSDISFQDSLWLHLELNGSPIMAVFPEGEEGEYSYPFYTGTKDPVMKIVGGTSVNIADYPWQVYLQAGDYACGGTIIGKKWILTAAHCTQDDRGTAIPASEMLIAAGLTNIDNYTQKNLYSVKSYTIHSNYNNSTYLNDIAVLELDEELNLQNAEVIELISTKDVYDGATDPGKISTVTGWGLLRGTDEPTAADYPNNLQMIQIPLVSNATAASVWGNRHESILFAGYKDGGKDACSGDSGGPLVVDVDGTPKVAGIVSWGSGDCDTYGAFTRVSYFLDWIETHTGITPGNSIKKPQGDYDVCFGTVSSDYYSENGDAGSYQWQFSPDSAGTLSTDDANATITWDASFIGFATLKVRGLIGGDTTAWSSSEIEVQPNTVLFSSPDDTTICEGDFMSFRIEAEGHDLTYNWYKDSLFYRSSTDGLLIFMYADTLNTGNYYCTVDGSCGELTTDKFKFTVLPNTVVENISKDQTAKQNEDVRLSVDSRGHHRTYQWFKDGKELLGDTLSYLDLLKVDATDIGNYQVFVNGTCQSDSSEKVFVYVDKTVSDKGLGRVWPSVIDDGFYTAISTTDVYQVEIMDSFGHLVLKKENLRLQQYIDISALSAGSYYVRIHSDGLVHTTKRIVVK